MKKLKIVNIIALTLMLIAVILTNTVYANDNLTFDKDPYDNESKRYYESLNINNEDERFNYLYNTIYKSLINLEDSVNLSKYGIPKSSEVFNIRKKVLYDHPEIFYFEHNNSVYWNNGELDFKYIESKDKLRNMINQLNQKVDSILKDNISSNMNNLEKVMAIHDYLVLNTEYAYNDDSAFDVYGILIRGKGVCQGYALSVKLFLNKLGIDSMCVPSDEMRHMWNIFNIDGEWYHMDCTWDDPLPDRKGIISYEYFALSDDSISRGIKPHSGWDKSKFPSCNSDKYLYLQDMGYAIKSNKHIYYRSENKRKGIIFRANKDGSIIESINISGYPIEVKDGYLYYKRNLQGKEIYKVDLNKFSYFIDINNHWAKNEIEDFYNLGFIHGDANSNEFRPDDPITRAEFVKIFNRYFGLTKTSGKTFDDTMNHWAKREIDIAFTNGVANGVSENLFNPDIPIKRQEVAKMISNYKKISDNKIDKINKFSDFNNVSPWAIQEVEGVLEAGYMKGDKGSNTFRPIDNITRAETVVTLSRIK